jgi:hypothetical protein
MENKKFKATFAGITCLLSSLLLVSSCDSDSVDDRYNLNFRLTDMLEFSWKPFMRIRHDDTSAMIDGKYPLCIQRDLSKEAPLQIFLFQTIPLPAVDSAAISICLSCKSLNMDNVTLKALFLDGQENLLHTDSVDANHRIWKSSCLSVNVAGARFLTLVIKGAGDTAQREQQLWLDRIALSVNGKSIYDYPKAAIFRKSSKPQIDESAITPYIAPGQGLPEELWSKKIVALGENMHGCRSLTEEALRIIRYAIERRGFRMVLLEQPVDKMLLWNAFVTGRTPDSTINVFRNELNITGISSGAMREFLVWLRAYNRERSQKVNIFGVDDISSPSRTANTLFDYAYSTCYNGSNRQQALQLITAVQYFEYDKALALLKPGGPFSAMVDTCEYALLRHVLNRYREVDFDDDFSVRKYVGRDYAMWLNVKKITEIYRREADHIMLYSHLDHSNKLDNSKAGGRECLSLGSYLHRCYGDSYFSIGMYVGEGYYIWQKEALPKAPRNSLEAFCLALKKEKLYMASSAFLGDGFFVRKDGDSFTYFFLRNRVDGVMFVRSNSWVNFIVDRADALKGNRELLTKRYALWEELRKPHIR